MKTCCKYKVKKSLADFHKDKSKIDGLYPMCKVCTKEKSRIWHKNNLEYGRKYNLGYRSQRKDQTLKRVYGISLEEHQKMLKEQNNRCAICLKEIAGKGCHVDHDHTSSKVRGLLCSKCNSGLGLFVDNVEALQRAVIYLNKSKEVK